MNITDITLKLDTIVAKTPNLLPALNNYFKSAFKCQVIDLKRSSYQLDPTKAEAMADVLQDVIDNQIVPEFDEGTAMEAEAKTEKQLADEKAKENEGVGLKSNPPRGKVNTAPDMDAIAKWRQEQGLTPTGPVEQIAPPTKSDIMAQAATEADIPVVTSPISEPVKPEALKGIPSRIATTPIEEAIVKLVKEQASFIMNLPTPPAEVDNSALIARIEKLEAQQAKLFKMLTALMEN